MRVSNSESTHEVSFSSEATFTAAVNVGDLIDSLDNAPDLTKLKTDDGQALSRKASLFKNDIVPVDIAAENAASHLIQGKYVSAKRDLYATAADKKDLDASVQGMVDDVDELIDARNDLFTLTSDALFVDHAGFGWDDVSRYGHGTHTDPYRVTPVTEAEVTGRAFAIEDRLAALIAKQGGAIAELDAAGEGSGEVAAFRHVLRSQAEGILGDVRGFLDCYFPGYSQEAAKAAASDTGKISVNACP